MITKILHSHYSVLAKERAANEAQTRTNINKNGSILTFERYMKFDEVTISRQIRVFI